MKTNVVSTALTIILCVFISSCVTKKVFLDMEQQKSSCTEREEQCLDREKMCNDTNAQLKSLIDSLNNTVASLDSADSMCRLEVDSLQRLTDELNDHISQLSSKAMSQKQLMDAVLNMKQAEIEKMETALNMKQAEIAKKEKNIEEMRHLIEKQENIMKNLLATIKNAIQQYDANDLTVELRDGKVYVAISDKLLFKSGSAKVDVKGKDALGILAKVLEKNPDLDVVVEGHTDSIPIKTERFTDNWDLSVLRATSVVRILCTDFGIPPRQITPSGRGEYFPKVENDTPENRAFNRRTEIIIAPKLNEIFKAISSFE